LQPASYQSWLEWSKLEEECGDIEESIYVLEKGLETCSFSEALLTKAIKQQERLNRVKEAREMLSILKREPTEKNWKSMLEGALFEARTGRAAFARKCLKYLMHHVSWYGPIYLEAFRLEEKCENFEAAYRIIHQGLRELPRYGPLWFGLLRLSERDDILQEMKHWVCGVRPLMQRIRTEKQRGAASISRELIWKLHFEAGQAEERAADICAEGRCRKTRSSLEKARDRLYNSARKCYSESLIACPDNLRWKVWLAGARLELAAGQLGRTRNLLKKAFQEAPEKSRAYVYLECSRVEEFVGNTVTARRILGVSRREVKHEWKVFLESVMMEARDGNMLLAIQVAKLSLNLHTGTGRLWALLIQLCHREECLPITMRPVPTITEHPIALSGYDPEYFVDSILDLFTSSPSGASAIPSKTDILQKALNEVPKSGEVWCEGARVYLNPLALETFDIGEAQRQLNFATQFTPQYGDTFVEILRLEILCQIFLPKVLESLGIPFRQFINSFLNEDPESDTLTLINEKWQDRPEVSDKDIEHAIVAFENFESILGINTLNMQGLSIEKLVRRSPSFNFYLLFCTTYNLI
jgi:la-related protein 1